MTQITATGLVANAFSDFFGMEPDVVSYAPGRVNLLGEHTDYNGGYVLPMALRGLGVSVAFAKGGGPGIIEAYSSTFEVSERRSITDGPEGRWSDYLLGCMREVVADNVAQTGLRVALVTSLPMGAGLSSSAALEVASIKGALELYGQAMHPVDVAIKARSVENSFVGMPCGIMDQFASSVGEPGIAMFLNTRTLDYAAVPSFSTHSFVIIESGVRHQLTEDGYSTRVAECKAACEALGVDILSDLDLAALDRVAGIAEPLNRRARHILTDNQRVLDGVAALKDGDVEGFGRLMIDSHASQRDDYEITVAETNALVDAALAEGALGARQTGGGWGGSVVALVENSKLDVFCDRIVADFTGASILAVT